jgi:hypothetical protein
MGSVEVKEKENRFGKHYRVSTVLELKGKKFKMWQDVQDPNKLRAQWRLTKAQMIRIIEPTSDSWLFRSSGHFDGSDDGWHADLKGFEKASQECIAWVLEQLREFDYYVYFNTGNKDDSGNDIEVGIFDIWNGVTHDFEMKTVLPILVGDETLE